MCYLQVSVLLTYIYPIRQCIFTTKSTKDTKFLLLLSVLCALCGENKITNLIYVTRSGLKVKIIAHFYTDGTAPLIKAKKQGEAPASPCLSSLKFSLLRSAKINSKKRY
jgi:hypothetical protein